MQSTEKITLVLRPHAGYTIADLQQYAKLGMPVGVGRSLGVIAGASEGDVMERAEQLESQVTLAEEALTRSKAHAAGWTDAQVLDFLSVALRHVVVEGELKYSDITDALKYMGNKGRPAFVRAFDMDEHIQMAADARRYRWLRDRTCIEDADNDLMVVRGDNYFDGSELDAEIDNGMRLDRLLAKHGETEPCAD
ncbi:hypothetical protein [Pseudomonas bohemica]|uniref:hypothetical protein n=1 Tax=Pseudomonas bohemica TaxID=2044872 RepID=UPI000DA63528|nr:hypothetical protein [Pseudomonas bohemica]